MQDVSTPSHDTISDIEAVTALAALYQGEKLDASAVFNTAMVMMGVAVAYLVGAVPFVGTLSEGPIARLSLVLLPLPLWLVIAFHSLMTLNAMAHGVSVRILEQALFNASKLRVKRDLVGSAAGDRIMDITKATLPHVITTVVVYSGVGFLVIGFTAYALYSAHRLVKSDAILVNTPIVLIATGVYAVILAIVVISWMAGMRMINEAGTDPVAFPK